MNPKDNHKEIGESMIAAIQKGGIKDSIKEITRVSRAVDFAMTKHAGQTRKGSSQPYIVHPVSVAMLVLQHTGSEDAMIAGLLHDVIEDTGTTHKEIGDAFGYSVADWVLNLTEQDKSLPWRTRKEQALEKVRTMEPGICLVIKAADKIDNLRSFYRSYIEQGPSMIEKFNAPLKEQIDMGEKLYLALTERNEKSIAAGQRGNPLLPTLRRELDRVKKVEGDYLKLNQKPDGQTP